MMATIKQRIVNWLLAEDAVHLPPVHIGENSVTISGDTIAFDDSTSDPSSDGEVQRNGTEVKVHTGGSVKNLSDIGSSAGVPSGTITLWSGAISNIPSGWVLCDGNNGTPDLRDKFVVGAGNSYSVDAIGGAETLTLTSDELPSHDHSDGTLDVASHSHSDGTLNVNSHDHGNGDLSATSGTDYVSGFGILQDVDQNKDGDTQTINVSPQEQNVDSDVDAGTTSAASPSVDGSTGSDAPGIGGSTGSVGSDSAHENRPPYYALAYVMKT